MERLDKNDKHDAEIIIDRLEEIGRSSGLIVQFAKEPKWIWPMVPRTASRCMRDAFKRNGCVLKTYGYNKHDGWFDNLTPENLGDWKIWTFVRNPYDRVISFMAYFQISVLEFIMKNHLYFEEATSENPRRVATHGLPCTFYTHIHGRGYMDFVGRFESLHKDWKNLLGVLRSKHIDLAPNKWKTNRPAVHGFYQQHPDLKLVVESMYGEDIKVLYDSGFLE